MTCSIHEFQNIMFNSTTTWTHRPIKPRSHQLTNKPRDVNRVTLGGYHLGFWSGGLWHVCSCIRRECEQVVQSVEGIHEVVGGKSTKSPHVEQLVSNTISTSPLLDSINCHTSWNHGVYNSSNINKSLNHD